ncbi:MAG: hypothetical protein IK082_05025 [Oscillospiraceae bacterium]|nr:hypothetical protein [Oscillospiraceae bacterium]
MADYDVTRHGYTLRLQITETATNVETNTSTISYKLQLISGNQYHFTDFGVGAEIKFDGTRVAYRGRDTVPYLSIGFNSTLTLLSGSKTVTHSSDGTKSIALAFTLDMADYYYTPGPMSGTGTFTCTTIPRATTPTLSSSSANLGSAVTISVAGRASTSFSHVLTYSIGSASGSIATLNTSTTSYSWTLPATIANQLPNSTSGKVTITCTTKSGSTTIGSKTVTLTANVPNNSTYNPSISSFSVTEQNATVSALNLGSSYLVQGKSVISISGTPSAKYGATIKSTTYSVGGTTVSSPTNISIKSSGSITISMTSTDSRGRSATSSSTKTSLAYSAPQVTAMNFFRSDANGNQDNSGEYLHYVFTGAITSLNSKNANTWALHIQRSGQSTWTSVASGTGYTLNVSGTSSSALLDVDYSYTARLTLTDSFGSSVFTYTVSTGYTTVDYRSTGKGIAFGKASEIDAFECNMEEYLRGGFHIYGNIAFDEAAQTGERYIRFGNASTSTNHHDIQLVGGNPNSVYGFQFYDRVNLIRVMGYNTSTQYLSFINDGTLSKTYTTNTYVSSTAFSYLQAYRRSNVYIIRGNVEVTTAIPTGTNWTEIGKLSPFSSLYTEYITVASQNGSGTIAVRIETDGTISIANTNGTAVSGLCRFSCAIVCA